MKVLSFGEIVWDVFDSRNVLGGAPLNFAAYISMLGDKGYLVSAVGNDELGRQAVEQIKTYGVDTEYISVTDDKETGKCIVTLNEKGIPSYKVLEDVAYDFISSCCGVEADVFTFGSLALRGEHNRATLKKILDDNKFGEIFVDVNIRAPFYGNESIGMCLENATIVKISDEELPVICKFVCGEDKDPKEAVSVISEKYPQIKLIIITKGDKGACCYDCIKKVIYNCNAHSTNVVSTVGAGDSFGASFLVKYMQTYDCQTSLEFASSISAKVCAYEGAILPKALLAD